jgi:hypothetical protein
MPRFKYGWHYIVALLSQILINFVFHLFEIGFDSVDLAVGILPVSISIHGPIILTSNFIVD